MKELKIDEELRDLLPPLKEEEFNQLEQNIIKEGCTHPIAMWNGYIADGHNRYKICKKNGINFETYPLAYESKEEVMKWMINGQFGQRNLEPVQKIEIAEKYRSAIETKARENQQGGQGGVLLLTKSSKANSEPVNTRQELARIAGVSEDTYSKGKKILESDNEEIKDRLRNGEIKINTAYKELFPKKDKENIEKSKTKICNKCNNELESNDFYEGHDICKNCEEKKSEYESNKNHGARSSGAFKDFYGNVSDYKPISEEDFNKLTEDIKTPKNIIDYVTEDDILLLDEVNNDFLEDLKDRLFNVEHLEDHINNNNIDIFNEIFNKLINELNNIKNNINEKVGK